MNRYALGRDTRLTVEHWGRIIADMPRAPRLMAGALPRKSPQIWRFINPRPYAQVIGCCVGCSGTREIETLLRIPPGATTSTDPLPSVDLSHLYTYWSARKESIDQGIDLGPEGAIVSHCILAQTKRGVVSLSYWPDDNAHEQAYSDSAQVPQAELAFGSSHVVVQHALITHTQMIYEYMSQGYPVQIGCNIGEGWMNPDPVSGTFRNTGRIAGGHATVALDYDLDQGWVAILNSWPQWGKRVSDPTFAATEGYTNIGYLPVDDFDAMMSDSLLSSGDSEAVVANTVGGFVPSAITFDFANWYGGSGQPE